MTTQEPSARDLVVERSIAAPLADVWQAATSPNGAQVLLGEGAALGDKGEQWQADDGSHGVLRSYHPHEQLRFTRHERAGEPATTIAVDFTDEGDATHVAVTQPAGANEAELREGWEKKLDRLAGIVER